MCYNPLTKKIVVSRDVIFDELGSLYNPKQNADNENEKDCHGNGDKAGQQSHR